MPAWEGGPQTGTSKGAAKTRQQLLEQAHADRDARKTERLRHQCAISIQCSWRGYQARVDTLQTVRVNSTRCVPHLSACSSSHRPVPDVLLCRYVSKLSKGTGRPYLPLVLVRRSTSRYLRTSFFRTSLSGSPLRATPTAMATHTNGEYLAPVKRTSKALYQQPFL